jgi:hypothetical protein
MPPFGRPSREFARRRELSSGVLRAVSDPDRERALALQAAPERFVELNDAQQLVSLICRRSNWA